MVLSVLLLKLGRGALLMFGLRTGALIRFRTVPPLTLAMMIHAD